MRYSQPFLRVIVFLVASIDPSIGMSANLSTLVSFNRTNGADPRAGLISDVFGNLYGTTSSGGEFDRGTIFKISADTNTLTTLVAFNVNDGYSPQAGLAADAAGNLYGTTTEGGAHGLGTLFEIAAGTNALTTLVSFNVANGAGLNGGLISDAIGNLYGMTSGGGEFDDGTVFEIAAGTNALTTLVSFNFVNGMNPRAGLISDSAGNLYGTTSEGGAHAKGTVFEIAADTHALTTLFSFDGTHGSYPWSDLIVDAAGNLFGTTTEGGEFGRGSVFKILSGTNEPITLFSFDSMNGAFPWAGLISDSTGNLYGTTAGGGEYRYGTAFKLTDTGFIVVPEVSSLALGSVGLLGLAILYSRRFKGSAA